MSWDYTSGLPLEESKSPTIDQVLRDVHEMYVHSSSTHSNNKQDFFRFARQTPWVREYPDLIIDELNHETSLPTNQRTSRAAAMLAEELF